MVATALTTTDQNVFQAMDRLDDEQIVAELQGAMLQEYVYEFQSGGKTVRGLSKSGTDDAARHMALKGEVLREESVVLEWQDNEAAYFKATVARYAVHNDGTEVKLDQVIGQKRQGKTAYGKPNEFWYEQGGQKALRNAKQKLIPESIKQQLIASYVEGGKVRRVDAQAPKAGRAVPAATPEPTSTAPTAPPAPKANGGPRTRADYLDRYNELCDEAQALSAAGYQVSWGTMDPSASIEEISKSGQALVKRIGAAKAQRAIGVVDAGEGETERELSGGVA